ncbi:hypothetical protein [Serratia fonticola]
MRLFERAPLYGARSGSLTSGTLTKKLGASINTLSPRKRNSPYDFHHTQEEMFVVLKGNGTLRVTDQMITVK